MRALSLATIWLRSATRRAGINRVVAQVINGRRGYEEVFAERVFEMVRPGDVVWDVGANVGFYSMRLFELVGSSGEVVAFEPNPACIARIRERSQAVHAKNIRLVEAALSDKDTTMDFAISGDECSTTSSLIERTHALTANEISVDVYRGDTVVERLGLPSPNLIKIDVEGFELECVRGLKGLLCSPDLRAILVEVHFSVLERRGQPYASLDLEQLFADAGFARLVWIDASHLAAYRL